MALPASNVENNTPNSQQGSAEANTAWPLAPQPLNVVSDEVQVEPNWKRRLGLGATLVLIGLAATAFALTGDAPQAQSIYALGISLISLVIVVYEGAGMFAAGRDRLQTLGLYPAAGVVLVACGVAGAAIFGQRAPDSPLALGLTPWAVGDPAILCGVFLILRAFSLRAQAQIGRAGTLLFPQEGHDLTAVKKGDSVSLRAGLVVATDSRIDSGSCAVLERYLSPVPTFRVKDETETVFAGSMVLSGSAQATAVSDIEDSCLRRLEVAVQPHVEASDAVIAGLDRAWISIFAQAIAFLAVAAAIFWHKRTDSIVLTLCACGLVLFAGAAGYLLEIVQNAGRGIVRSMARAGFVSTQASTLNDLLGISRIVFDPSRIDAQSACRVSELEILDDRIGRAELCSCVASLLGRADDAVLAAAGDYCQGVVGQVATERVVDLREYPGRGISGSVKGIEISIGSEEFIIERGIMLQPSELASTGDNERVLVVALDTNVIARFWIELGQSDLVSEAPASLWPEPIHALIGTGFQGEAKEDTLLVRGRESEVLGRSARLEVGQMHPDRLGLPACTLVALTNRLEKLPEILSSFAVQKQRLSRAKLVAGLVSIIAVAAVFAGGFSALIPLGLFAIVAFSLI